MYKATASIPVQTTDTVAHTRAVTIAAAATHRCFNRRISPGGSRRRPGGDRRGGDEGGSGPRGDALVSQ